MIKCALLHFLCLTESKFYMFEVRLLQSVQEPLPHSLASSPPHILEISPKKNAKLSKKLFPNATKHTENSRMNRPPIQSRSVSLSASLRSARCTRWNGQTTKPEVTKPEKKEEDRWLKRGGVRPAFCRKSWRTENYSNYTVTVSTEPSACSEICGIQGVS